ncbi:MAG: pstI1 [Frankiales bacterium]|nr:pstI1 [Frankiales bacterium]
MSIRSRALPAAAVLAVAAALVVPAQASSPGLLSSTTYIVTLAPSVVSPQLVAELTKPLGGKVGFVYSHALKGFSVTLPTALVPALQLLPGVATVERDQVVHVDTTQLNPPSYGLDRIDARSGLNKSYSYTSSGAGVTAYIIDTGITYSHTDFGGRARAGYDAVTSGGGAVDCNGHGTHVSGTVGGTKYGVAKNVKLVGVRVLDCSGSGTTAGVVAGIDWVAAHRVLPAVANMSLGGGADAALDAAVNGAIAKGVTFGVAAGNDGSMLNDLLGLSNACNGSPSRVPAALTVAATDSTDTRATYSNRGSCVDIWAPGTNITSDWMGSTTATKTISGTSMATPHVVGVAALYLSAPGNSAKTPAQVASALTTNATQGVVKNAGSGTPNRLVFENY